jgi:hypothetical protein
MITIKCQISLSKKLRALIGNNTTTLTLITGELVDGKGEGNIILAALEEATQKSVDDLINNETSIMLIPESMSDSIPKGVSAVTSIFAPEEDTADIEEQHPVRKMASFSAPETRKEVKYAIKSKQKIEEETPEVFESTQEPSFKKFVSNLDQLLEAIQLSEHKVSDIDIDAIKDPRKRAVAMEAKEKAEAIDYPAFIVNDKYADLTINDLGIHLVLNMPYNLENVSAKRLAASKEIKALFRQNMIKFIHPDDVQGYLDRAKEANMEPEYKVFGDKTGSAKRALETLTNTDRGEELMLEVDEMDAPTEQERLVSLTTKPIVQQSVVDENGVRRTVHGSKIKIKKSVSQESKENKAGLKTIRRTGIEFK